MTNLPRGRFAALIRNAEREKTRVKNLVERLKRAIDIANSEESLIDSVYGVLLENMNPYEADMTLQDLRNRFGSELNNVSVEQLKKFLE